MEFEDHPLWNFTIEAHPRPGVHDACMALQMENVIDTVGRRHGKLSDLPGKQGGI